MGSYLATSALFVLFAANTFSQVQVFTANYDNARTNANLQETTLSPATVSPGTFGKVASFPVDGQIYAQPLVVTGLTIPGKGVHDVVFVSTMHNSVYAFDATATGYAAPLWQVNLGPSVPSTFLNIHDAVPEVGILSTGVIDPAGGILYVLAETLENNACVFRLHALDLTTGQERLNGPTVISAQVNGNGSGSQDGVLVFDPMTYLQRPGLLLLKGRVYAAFGSHQDQGSFHGWMIGYDASDLTRQTAVFMTTPNGLGGSIWQSGRGPAADDADGIYVVTGNGDYDGTTAFSESFLKFDRKLALVDWHTPANWQMLSDGDYDLSAGPALLPGTHTLIGGNKYGNLYLVDGNAMGHLAPDDSTGTRTIQAVEWGGVFNFAVWNREDAAYVYVQEQGSVLKGFRIANGAFDTTPFSTSTARADIPYDGIAVSANGSKDGIVWKTTGDHTVSPVPGSLHAFDATDLTRELWNSDASPQRDSLGAFAKFVSPTVANGRVYVPTFSNQLAIYGILPSGPPEGGDPLPAVTSVRNAASPTAADIAPGELVQITGSNFGPAEPAGPVFDSNGIMTTQVSDTRVLFDGVAAPILSTGPNQATAVTPFSVAVGSSQIQVEYQGHISDPVPVTVAPSAPALFSMDGTGAGQSLAVNQDGTVNSAQTPAPAGSVVLLYATGLGQTSPPSVEGSVASEVLAQAVTPVTLSIDGQWAEVLYAGSAPGIIAGISQINVVVPEGVSGQVPVVIQAGQNASQPATTIAVEAAPVMTPDRAGRGR